MSGTELVKHDSADSAGRDEHAAVANRSSGDVVRYNPDAPSEEWGWHGEWHLFAAKGSKTLLVVFALVMFAMLLGNHVSHVEDWYLVLVGLSMFGWLAWREAAARRRRRMRP